MELIKAIPIFFAILLILIVYPIIKTKKTLLSLKDENFKIKINKKSNIKNILKVNLLNADASPSFIISITCYIILIYICSILINYNNENIQESKELLLGVGYLTLGIFITTSCAVIRNTYSGLIDLGVKGNNIILYGYVYDIEYFRSYKWREDTLLIEVVRNHSSIAEFDLGNSIQYKIHIPIGEKSKICDILDGILITQV